MMHMRYAIIANNVKSSRVLSIPNYVCFSQIIWQALTMYGLLASFITLANQLCQNLIKRDIYQKDELHYSCFVNTVKQETRVPILVKHCYHIYQLVPKVQLNNTSNIISLALSRSLSLSHIWTDFIFILIFRTIGKVVLLR